MIPPLVPIAVAFALGIFVASRLSFAPGVPFIVGLCSLLISFKWRQRLSISVIALVGLWMGVGMLRTISWAQRPPRHVASLVSHEPEHVYVHGIVVDDPVELFSPNEPERQVCVVNALYIRTQEGRRSVTGLIRARLRDPRVRLAYGDEVLLEGRWSSVPSPGNPGQYDWQAALARQRIHALLAVEPYHGVVRLQRGQGSWWFRAIYALRHRLERLIDAHFSAYHAGLLRSLLLGQRVALDETLKRTFVETGTVHVLATQNTKLHRDSLESHVTIFKTMG